MNYDLIVIGGGPAGYVGRDPRRAARQESRLRGKGARRRHLPQLGLHPDQVAAQERRALPPHDAPRGGVRLQDRTTSATTGARSSSAPATSRTKTRRASSSSSRRTRSTTSAARPRRQAGRRCKVKAADGKEETHTAPKHPRSPRAASRVRCPACPSTARRSSARRKR